MNKTRIVLAAALAVAAGQALACYTVYDSSNRVVYSADTAPVDMSRPLHETLPAAFPRGSSLVFDGDASCPWQMQSRNVMPGVRSPLLTDARTAQAMGLPHKMLANGVAMVSERPDSMRPGVMLAESGLPRNDTSALAAGPGAGTGAMGAGPAPAPATRAMGAAPAPDAGAVPAPTVRRPPPAVLPAPAKTAPAR